MHRNFENFKQGLKALEGNVVKGSIILSDTKVVALEVNKHSDEACGEIEAIHPSYFGSKDTF